LNAAGPVPAATTTNDKRLVRALTGCVPAREARTFAVARPSAELNPKDFGHNAWWINASGRRNDITKMKAGDTLHVTNGGGILHTFTEFPQFGGGRIPATGVPQGTSKNVTLSVGTHRFQCVFHPWMRQTFQVSPADAT
jgi:plastocyanin